MAGEEGGDSGDNSMGWVGAIGAAALGGALSSYGQSKTNEANKEIAHNQMAFQERMSNTAYQRAVKDMAKAGINPMLVSQVGGATSPSGSMPQVQNTLSAGVSGAQQAMAAANQYQDIQTSKASAAQFTAQAEKLKSETLHADMNAAEQAARVSKLIEEAKHTKTDADKKQQEILGVISDSATKHAAFEAQNRNGYFESQAKLKGIEEQAARYGLSKDKVYSDYYKTQIGASEPYVGLGSNVLNSASSVRRAFGTSKIDSTSQRR